MVNFNETINPVTPDFMNWVLPSPSLVTSIVGNRGFSLKANIRMTQCRSR